MASWPNLNFALPPTSPNNKCTVPPPPFPPLVGVPPVNILPPPFPPPSLGLARHPYGVPPPCLPNIPPPNVLSYPPPMPDLVGKHVNQRVELSSNEDKFEKYKEQLEKKYKFIFTSQECTPHKMKISTIKQQLTRCFSLTRQLDGLLNCLQITHKSLSEEEWIHRSKEIESIKAELSDLITSLDNPENIKQMLKVIKWREKKLNYRKRKRKQWQEQKRELKLYSEQENRRIDQWLEKMKDEVSRAKREEDIKREADLVLSDVTAKKTEAKRVLNLLNSLAKLRAARVQQLPAGQHDGGSDVFNKIIERLKKMWLDQIKEYNVEEQGLKVMLEHAEEERISVEVAEFRKKLKSWNKLIFGSSNASFPQTLEEFVQARHDWDEFIRTGDTFMASSIPVGWVLPSEPSSEEWKKFLT